jgi:hypothetical protein
LPSMATTSARCVTCILPERFNNFNFQEVNITNPERK